MKMKTKILGIVGALLVTMSATGAVAYAGTTNDTGRSQYASQIQTERQQIKSLQEQRQQLNQQLKTYFEGFKGQHLKKNNPIAYQAIRKTHQQVISVRTKLESDSATIKSDRQSKNWARLVTDLQTKATDLQSLIGLKQQQLKNVQAVSVTSRIGLTS
ncbi:hypothetical protein NZD89_03050 [Alicyclobacillus fastidiosus]|uniref:Uncharacterized protein n=1 Tax=Alicyclobacillus fastidiosus TaxID=392011 RepID=A0ABY6ZJ28_9BACL|nr:hypothetical protein [Alicyclobacillus fastidiosus]WAH42487.1 hypothetical protein NZD89_03050 [Alicyclobacillus fastidiosus]GMA64321.1 hypothetical protein GCM10025859_47610 [Alicyclobacillus fastidiosus]